MTRVLVIGGSDQGRQAIDVLESAGGAEVVGVLDRGLATGTRVDGYPVLGRDDELAGVAAAHGVDAYLVAIGDNAVRGRIVTWAQAAAPALTLARAIHPRAAVSAHARIGPGAIVMADAVVSNGCHLGTGVLLGTKASLDHDCTTGDFASCAPGVTAGGRVTIGSYTAIGLGANAINGVTIGEHTVVGAGAIVIDDLPSHVVAFGVPARVTRIRAEGEVYLSRSRAAGRS